MDVPKTWNLELPQQLFTGRLQALGVGVGWLIGWLHSIERYLVRVGVGKPLLAHCIGWLPPYPFRHAGIPLEILIAPWGSWAYSYRIRLPAHICPLWDLQNMKCQEHQETSRVQRMSTQEWVCKAFFGRETWGAPKFRAIPSQASTPHVQNGALRWHSAMGGINFPKKEQTQPCTTHSVQGSFLIFAAYVFLGPWLYKTCFFKNQLIFWGWVHDSFFPSWLRLSGKILCMCSFPFFNFWCTANMLLPCKSSVCFWVFFCVMRQTALGL